MDPAQRSALRKCRVRLVNDLYIEEMFDSIETKSLFTPIMLECIKAKESRPEKVRTLLDYLQRRGPNAFDLFIQCLRETGHDFAVSYLFQSYLDSKNNSTPSNGINPPGSVSMSNNMYLNQETQRSWQGQMSSVMETQGPGQGQMSSVMETQGPAKGQMSSVMETQRPAQIQMSSVIETLGSNGAEAKEEAMQEDNMEDGLMDQSTQPQSWMPQNESRIPGSTAQGTCSTSAEPQPSLPGQFSSALGSSGYTGNFTEEYRMETDPRGLLLIINNRMFGGGLSNRDGTDVDCERLKSLFMSLGFGVDVRNNLTAREILDTLNILARHDQLKNVDSLAVALLTHGSEDYLYGTDARFFNVNEAFMPFTAEKCPALHHKPKFFIINACRGDAEDKGSFTHSHETLTASDVTNIPPLVGSNQIGALFGAELEQNIILNDVQTLPPEPRSSGDRIPNMKDFLVAFSTIPGHVSWRHLNDGSFFIQGFVKVFQEHAQTSDVLRMLVKVNNEVSRNINHQGVQIPAPQVMLTRTWFLNPAPRQYT